MITCILISNSHISCQCLQVEEKQNAYQQWHYLAKTKSRERQVCNWQQRGQHRQLGRGISRCTSLDANLQWKSLHGSKREQASRQFRNSHLPCTHQRTDSPRFAASPSSRMVVKWFQTSLYLHQAEHRVAFSSEFLKQSMDPAFVAIWNEDSLLVAAQMECLDTHQLTFLDNNLCCRRLVRHWLEFLLTRWKQDWIWKLKASLSIERPRSKCFWDNSSIEHMAVLRTMTKFLTLLEKV